jgi:pilus assembly protein Flp/PilA
MKVEAYCSRILQESSFIVTIHLIISSACAKYALPFLADERGQDLIEYALVAALVALGSIATLKNVSTKLVAVFGGISSGLTSAV